VSSNENLKQQTQSTAQAIRDALGWVCNDKNADKVGLERGALEKTLRRLSTQVRKLTESVDRPMCVGVFGPSQAGKSYLVSVLAKDSEKPLLARFADSENLDFISKINPPGERESTGIVTRFSLNSVAHPPTAPVCLRLLSELDIIKILGNTRFLDGDPKTENPFSTEEAESALAAAGDTASGAPRFSQEDVWDLQEYFNKHFDRTPQLLPKPFYWERAAELATKLDLTGRAQLFSPLWGNHTQFTELYLQLAKALETLGHAQDGFCSLEALVPREQSIIDVATLLAGIGGEGGDTLSISTQAGFTAALPRAVVAALTAELRIVLANKPHTLFEQTDLLDFPGARSRQPLNLKAELEKPGMLGQAFLRGKIAYLFDRYVAEQELTSMLLCIRDSTQEVVSLPEMINDWIAVSHGATPEERVNNPVVLFIVLTMFDKHFNEKAGDDDHLGARFANRIKASITNFLGSAHTWPETWTPNQAFNNTFWLRNPNFKAEFMIRYEGRQEKELLQHKLQQIENLKTAYLQEPLVQTYFADPERAWKAALELNDGGVSYLIENLASVCNSSLKDKQIASRLSSLQRHVHERLQPYYVSEDVETRLTERRMVCERIVQAVYASADGGRFGPLLRALQLDSGTLQDQLYRSYARVPMDSAEDTMATPANAAVHSRKRPLPGRPLPGNSTPISPPASEPRPSVSRFAKIADATLSYWVDTIRASAASERICRYLHMDPELMGEMISELIAASRRLQLKERIANKLEQTAYSMEHLDQAVAKAALIGWCEVGKFVSYAGFADTPEQDRPEVELEDGTTHKIFAERSEIWTTDGITDTPQSFDENWLIDWVFGFYRLVEENAVNSQGQAVDLKQNAKLGQVLSALHT
jgi:hypothetical protein